jgi:hypothetical protein
MAASRRYNEELRVIGQALEAKGVAVFELHSVKAGYFIQDLREHRPSLIRKWLGRHRENDGKSLTYGFELPEVEQLSRSGQARRSQTGQLTNFRDLSNILRTIGAYLDAQEVELVELHKNPISITIAYRDKWGNEQREDRPVSSFQNFFREVIRKRSLATTTRPRS